MPKSAKRPLSSADKEIILRMAQDDKDAPTIAKYLGVDARQVSGFTRSAINFGRMGPQATSSSPSRSAPPPPLTQEDVLKELAKKWRGAEPDAEFSMHTEKGMKVHLAAYKGGVVLSVGKQKKGALLTAIMAQRLGMKLSEMATWSRS